MATGVGQGCSSSFQIGSILCERHIVRPPDDKCYTTVSGVLVRKVVEPGGADTALAIAAFP